MCGSICGLRILGPLARTLFLLAQAARFTLSITRPPPTPRCFSCGLAYCPSAVQTTPLASYRLFVTLVCSENFWPFSRLRTDEGRGRLFYVALMIKVGEQVSCCSWKRVKLDPLRCSFQRSALLFIQDSRSYLGLRTRRSVRECPVSLSVGPPLFLSRGVPGVGLECETVALAEMATLVKKERHFSA